MPFFYIINNFAHKVSANRGQYKMHAFIFIAEVPPKLSNVSANLWGVCGRNGCGVEFGGFFFVELIEERQKYIIFALINKNLIFA